MGREFGLTGKAFVPARRAVRRLGSFLLYGGTRHWRDYELAVLDCLRSNLDQESAAVLSQQMAAFHYLKRAHSDRMVHLWFYDAVRLPRFEGFPVFNKIEDQCELLRFEIKARNGKRVRGVVTCFRGVLRTIEFKTSPTALENADVTVSSIASRVFALTLAEEVDASEHRS